MYDDWYRRKRKDRETRLARLPTQPEKVPGRFAIGLKERVRGRAVERLRFSASIKAREKQKKSWLINTDMR